MIRFWWLINLSAVIQDLWIIYPYWVVAHSLAERCSPQCCFYFVGLQSAKVKTCQYEGFELCIRRRPRVIEIQHAIQIIPQVKHCCTQTLIRLNYHSGTLRGQWSNCCWAWKCQHWIALKKSDDLSNHLKIYHLHLAQCLKLSKCL